MQQHLRNAAVHTSPSGSTSCRPVCIIATLSSSHCIVSSLKLLLFLQLDGADLASLYSEWCSKDARFTAVSPHLPGARMLRQDPVECLFEFICSSNNHIR
jgi:hypothetical protein